MPLLDIRGLTRSFGPTRALDGVTLSLAPGEIVALMGANGAGKSTLVNLIAGALPPSGGEMLWRGGPYRPAVPAEATRSGIVVVHQSTDRIGAPDQTVADALLLDAYADGRTPFFLTRARVRRTAGEILAASGFDLPLDESFGALRPAGRQLVAIARAVARQASLLILDEPTASLSSVEAERLYGVLGDLKARGIAILYISHRIADLKVLADRALVLREGRVVAEARRPIDFDSAVEAMIGRPLSSAQAAGRAAPGAEVFSIEGLQLAPGAEPISLSLRAGEVVAVTGPLGAGKSRLLATLFGAISPVAGAMRLDGGAYHPSSPSAAIAAGVAYAGEDRHVTSLMPAGWPGAKVATTISLPHLARWFPRGILVGDRERQEGVVAIERLGIRATGPWAGTETLSGGNQQKTVLARWQAEPARLLLLDEPFQGVDVGARADIIAAVRAGVAGATLIATSDPEEALEAADRIFLMERHNLLPFTAEPLREAS